MKVNRTRDKLLAGQPAFGFELSMGSPFIAEALADCGADFLQIDHQHGDWGPESTLHALMALEGHQATPIARAARNDYTMIGRLLDHGVLGVVVPMVDTVEDARLAAAAARFPPRGNRSAGWGRIGRADETYWHWVDDQVLLMVQIESALAVENAEEILATPGVDGCWIGPSDLAFSLGVHPSEMDRHDGHARAIERVLEACRNTGKIPGFAAFTVPEAIRRLEQGFLYLTAGSDGGFLVDGAANAMRRLGEAEKGVGRRA